MLKDEIDQDVLVFFDKIDGLGHRDKVEMLRLILKKYALLSQADCLLDKHDLLDISSKAKKNMSEDNGVVFLGERRSRLDYDEIRMKCIADAVISVLNHKECFKRLPKFDVREDLYPED